MMSTAFEKKKVAWGAKKRPFFMLCNDFYESHFEDREQNVHRVEK